MSVWWFRIPWQLRRSHDFKGTCRVASTTHEGTPSGWGGHPGVWNHPSKGTNVVLSHRSLCPTKSSSLVLQAEAEALVTLLEEFPDAKAWITLSCKVYMIESEWERERERIFTSIVSSPLQDSHHTCHGDLFSEAVNSVSESSQVTAVGINCSSPQHVEVSNDQQYLYHNWRPSLFPPYFPSTVTAYKCSRS